jgi:hypothetical protein
MPPIVACADVLTSTGNHRPRGADVVLVARHDNADRLDLVNRGVGGVAAAGCGIEQDLAAACLGEPPREQRRLDRPLEPAVDCDGSFRR